MTADISYASNGSLKIAYSVMGDGPLDLVMVPGFISHVEYALVEPSLARFLRLLSGYSRVVTFDKRGMGLSDRDRQRETPTMQERLDDLGTVIAAAGSRRPVLFGWCEGGPLSLLFAAAFPERVSALILFGTSPRFTAAPDFSDGVPTPVMELVVDALQEEWGTGVGLELYAPSMAGDARMRRWWAAYQRLAATPGAVAASLRMHLDVDVRNVLSQIAIPTLVLHRHDDRLVPVACAHYMARRIPGVCYVELPGSDHLYWLGDQDLTLNVVKDFLAHTLDGPQLRTVRQRHGHPSLGWEALTQTELDVARLVTEGLTNREIAHRLYVSPRTVQTHVASVFRKLGLSRRSELAVEAFSHLHHPADKPRPTPTSTGTVHARRTRDRSAGERPDHGAR